MFTRSNIHRISSSTPSGHRSGACLIHRLVAVLLAAITTLGSTAHAAGDFNEIEQRLPAREPSSSSVALPSAPNTMTPDSEIPTFGFVLAAIVIEGSTVFETADFSALYEPYLATQVSMQDITSIADAITKLYRDAGYILSRAIVPAQSGAGGVVHLNIVEGYIDEVRIDGASSQAVQRRLAPITRERPLRIETLERALALTGDIPGVAIEGSQLEPDLDDLARYRLVVTIGLKRLNGWFYADNRGVGDAGDAQTYISGAANSVLRAGDQLTVGVFTAVENPDKLLFAEAGYSFPLNASGSTLSVYGSSSRTLAGATLTTPDVQTEYQP